MTDVDVRVDDHGEQRRLEQLALFMQDLRPFWPLVVPLVTGWWRRQFQTEGSFGGAPWAPLALRYAASKAVRHPGKGILEATGDLRRAASDPLRAQTPLSLTLTIEDPKLQYHQQEDGPVANLPRRPLVFGDPLPPLAQAELDEAAETYVRDLLHRL